MKRFLPLLFLVLALRLPAQFNVQTNIQEVTVFFLGAEIIQEQQINLKPGLNTIILQNVSSQILTRSVQIPDAELILINASLDRRFSDEEMMEMMDHRDLLNAQLEALNKKIVTLDNFHNAQLLESMLNFYEKKGKQLNKDLRAIKKKIVNAQKANELFKSEHTANLRLLISNEKNLSKKIRIKYLTGGAGWAPSYEIFARSDAKELDLKYIAKIMNQTGADWNHVQLSLSTALPLEEAQSMPRVKPWFITNNRSSNFPPADNPKPSGEIAQLEGVEYAEIKVPSASTVIPLPNEQTVPANGAVYSFGVMTKKLPISYAYYSIPSIERAPFLIARISEWQSLPLLDATAKVTFNGLNVGNTIVNVSSAGDTLDISLGKDDGISVERSAIGNKTFHKQTNQKIKETRAYEYVLRNNRNEPVDVYLFDQIPISQTNSVKVSIGNLSFGKLKKEDGEVLWHYRLKPAEEKENIELVYTMEYPVHFKNSISGRVLQEKAKSRYRQTWAPSL